MIRLQASMVLYLMFCLSWLSLRVGHAVDSNSAGQLIDHSILTQKQRTQLLQIDAAATGAVIPSTSSEEGELSWSLSPSHRASITEEGKWLDLPNNNLTFTLTRESHVVIKYLMVVVANQRHHSGGDFLKGGAATVRVDNDFLGARLLLDGMPYRQSGSHAAPLSTMEVSTRQMSGYIVSRLGAGSHTVSLQWRKWGTQVGSWTVSPTFRDGFVAGRALTVTSRHRYLWFAQPLSVARTVVASDKWHTVRDMEITFNLPRDWTLRFAYSLQVRPQGAPNTDVLTNPDFLSTRITLDNQAYRESSTVSSSATHTYGCATLSGEVTMKVPAGSHTVKLQWRRYGPTVPLWWSHPNFLDGFVSGRILTVTGEMYPYVVSQPLSEARLKTPLKTAQQQGAIGGTNTSSVWHDVGTTAIQFDMINAGRVSFSYDVGVSQYGSPDFDEWTWSRWSSIATRLVVDGRPFTHTGGRSDALVRANENLRGDITLTLPAGSHTARLQWRTFGESVSEWTTFQNILDGFGSSRTLLAMVHSVNSQPIIVAPLLMSVDEDTSVNLVGVTVFDSDVDVTPHGTVAVQVSAGHGALTIDKDAVHNLTFATGDGKEDSMMTFVGTLDDVNVALNTFSYKPHPDYNGMEEVKIRVTDQGFTGGDEGSKTIDHNVQINVRAKNDQPTFTVPAPQTINEDATLLINGVGVFDVDVERTAMSLGSIFEVHLHVVSGRLTLRPESTSGTILGLTFLKGDGTEDAAMSFQGTLSSINAALSRLEYTGDANSNSDYAEESLTLRIRDLTGDGEDSGASAYLNDTVTIPIHVSAVNDAPAVVVPRTQTVVLSGYQVSDVDLAVSSNICVNVSVASKQGHVSLATLTGITMSDSATGIYERFMSFKGTVAAVNNAMVALEYVRSPAFDGGDVIAVSLMDCASQQMFGETTMIELDINNRVGSTLSSDKRPAILTVVPHRGNVAGSTPVIISGTNFVGHGSLFCQFGSKDAVVSAVLESNTSLVCVTPSGLEPGAVLLRVTNNVDIWTNASEFVFDAPLTLLSVLPDRGTVLGGTTLVLSGLNFPDSDQAQCIFGMTTKVPARWQSEGTVHCTSPEGILGQTTIQFSPNGVDIDTTQVLVYTYDSETLLSSIWPSQGSSSGGTLIKVTGSNFRASTQAQCRFGNQDVKATYLSPTSLQCLAPTGNIGVVLVRVTMNGVDYSKDSLQFQWTNFVQIVHVSPRGGFVAGGTEVEVTTKNLRRGSYALCKFGNSIINATYEARNLLKCISPPSKTTTNQYTTLEISTNGQDFTTDGVRFHYQLPAVVTAVTPQHGDIQGGTIIHVHGRNFHDSNSLFCAFGSSIPSLWRRRAGYRPDTQCNYVKVLSDGTCAVVDEAVGEELGKVGAGVNEGTGVATSKDDQSLACFVRASWINETHIACVAPPFKSGIVKVEVTTNDFDYTTNKIEYQYRASPTVTSITPAVGGINGGTMVTVKGHGFIFSSLLACLFGNVASVASYINATTLTCTSPPSGVVNGIGSVTLTVMANGIDRSSSSASSGMEPTVSFVYVALPTVSTMEPMSGPHTKSTIATVHGAHFTNTTTLTCRFFVDGTDFNQDIQGNYVNNTSMTCLVPTSASFTTTAVTNQIFMRVSTNGQDFSQSVSQFSYNNDIYVDSVSPGNGPMVGGTVLLVNGDGFYDSSKLFCAFTDTVSNDVATVVAKFVSHDQVQCTTPTTTSTSVVRVSVTTNGIRYGTTDAAFVYVDAPSITKLYPSIGIVGAATVVQIQGNFPHTSPTLTCLFGVRSAPATFINSTHVVCTIPFEDLRTPAVYQVTVSSNRGYDSSNSLSFTIYEKPSITNIANRRGGIGTVLRIYGVKFVNTTQVSCKFGNNIDHSSATFVSSTEITCPAPKW